MAFIIRSLRWAKNAAFNCASYVLIRTKKPATNSERFNLSYSPWTLGTKSWGQSIDLLGCHCIVDSVTGTSSAKPWHMSSWGRSRQLKVRTCNSNCSFSFWSWTSWICWSYVNLAPESSEEIGGGEGTGTVIDLDLECLGCFSCLVVTWLMWLVVTLWASSSFSRFKFSENNKCEGRL